MHKKANKTHGLVMRRADGIHFVDKYQPLAAILSDFLGPQWLRLAAKKKKKNARHRMASPYSIFYRKSDCSTGCMENHMWGKRLLRGLYCE